MHNIATDIAATFMVLILSILLGMIDVRQLKVDRFGWLSLDLMRLATPLLLFTACADRRRVLNFEARGGLLEH